MKNEENMDFIELVLSKEKRRASINRRNKKANSYKKNYPKKSKKTFSEFEDFLDKEEFLD